MSGPDRKRCAIYTRKSTDEGLEKDFNSLHAQREACESFIKSQRGEGWEAIKTQYDDGGFSGGSTERPALQRLLSDIKERRVDVVVVYKVDRLTRSLADFAKMVEVFDAHGISFVAVTQQFNTTSSMGRLTLNVLLSFAQFEREVTGERIRDKIAASKRKGMWMGGVTPLGYEVRDRKLIVVKAEAETVRYVYDRYLEIGSVRLLKYDLDRSGIRSKARVYADGTRAGNNSFSRGALYALLSNPIYIGEISHKGERHLGQHKPILESSLWQAVQRKLGEQGPGPLTRDRKTEPSPLIGKLFDASGNRLTPNHTVKKGHRYRYYVSVPLTKGAANEKDGWRIPARQLEAIIADGAAQCLADRGVIATTLKQANIDLDAIPAVLKMATEQERRLRSESERAASLVSLVERVELLSSHLKLTLSLAPLVPPDAVSKNLPPVKLTRDFPFRIKRRGAEMRLIIGSAPAPVTDADPNLLREVARARRCFEAIVTGKVSSIDELHARENIDERAIRRTLPLAFLAPDIVQAIVMGTQPIELTARKLMRRIDLPLDWPTQRKVLGFG
jgi:DNA invertase Pin-like site-specific DNA recombinase